MKRTLIVALLTGLLAFGLAWISSRMVAERTTTSRLSPDETLRAGLVESDRKSIDRNFQIRIEDLVNGNTTTIYRSPHEGMPYGTERLIWSKDGNWLLLVGRHFMVKEDLFLDSGDQLYFLYHLPSKNVWLNSAEFDTWPALKAEMIEGVEFTETVRFKAR